MGRTQSPMAIPMQQGQPKSTKGKTKIFKRRSIVWNFFTWDEKARKANCKNCPKLFNYHGGSTFPLLRHMRMQHGSDVDGNFEVKEGTSQNSHPCLHCNLIYDNPISLKNHNLEQQNDRRACRISRENVCEHQKPRHICRNDVTQTQKKMKSGLRAHKSFFASASVNATRQDAHSASAPIGSLQPVFLFAALCLAAD